MVWGTRIPVLVAAFIIYGPSTQLRGDIRLVYREASPAGAQFLTILLRGDRAAFLHGEPGKELITTLYDRQGQSLLFINHQERHYTVLSREWAKEMRQRIEETSRRLAEDMKKQAASLPPDLRPFYLQAQTFSPWLSMFSQSALAPGTGQPRQFLPLTGTRQAGNYRCRPAELRQAGKKQLELCMSDFSALGFPEGDAKTWRAMQADAFELQKLGAFLFGFTPPPPLRIGPESEGIAVQFRDIAGKGPMYTLESVSNDTVDPIIFELPAEYLQAVIPLPSPLF